MFPARAGMNRQCVDRFRRAVGVPRPRGDEPAEQEMGAGAGECSPPARG